jgi:hypothetical protein
MKTILVKLLLLTALVSFYFNGYTQNSRNQILLTSAPLTWNLATTTQLESEQQINNALTITAHSNNAAGYNVYVRVSNMTNTSGTPMPASMNKFQLYNQSSSSGAAPVTAKITLSQTDQLIISDIDRTNNSGDIFYYNAFFGPVGYNYAPGTYTFTVLFTMTQP